MAVLTETTKTGEARYKVRYRVDGKQKEKTFRKHRAAVDFDDKTKTQLRDGTFAEPSNYTVKEIGEKWLASRKARWKPQTFLQHQTHLRKYIEPKLGHIKSTSLRIGEVETAAGEWVKLVSAKTTNKVITTLSTVYKFAKKLGIMNNPVADVERLRDQVTPEEHEARALGEIADHGTDAPEQKSGTLRAIAADEVYSALELKKIIDAATPGYEKACLMVAILEGPRHGELGALRWPVVDLKKGSIFINRSLTWLKGGPVLERPKTKNAYRRLKLAPELLAELKKWKLQCPPNPNDLVFVNELCKPVSRNRNNAMLKSVCERAGVRALSMNNLRHSFASQHLSAGTQVLEVSKLMGHSTPDVTWKVYARWADRENSTAELALAGRIFGAEEQQATGSE